MALRIAGLFQRAAAKPGETVLVHGASGGVGTAAVQLARAAGMIVIGTAGSEDGIKQVKEQGAQHGLNHSADGYLDELMKLTDGKGVDVIIELLANKNLGRDLTVLAKKGRVAVIGSRGAVEINPRDAMGREADIRGVTLVSTSEPGISRDACRADGRSGERHVAAADRQEDFRWRKRRARTRRSCSHRARTERWCCCRE